MPDPTGLPPSDPAPLNSRSSTPHPLPALDPTASLPAAAVPATGLPRPVSALRRVVLGLIAFASLVLIVHNYCFSVFPRIALPLAPSAMLGLPGGVAVAIDFDHSPGGTQLNPRSRVTLTENGTPLIMKLGTPVVVRLDGSGSWSHLPGKLIFSSTDNSDPRTNGRHYVAHSPPFYSRRIGYAALAVFLAAVLLLRRRVATPAVPLPPPADSTFRRHVLLASLVFLAGLYAATGTLAPYANTLIPRVDPATGYLYNIDLDVHRTVFAFVDGAPRAAWENSLLLRRVLYSVLAWPWQKNLGYEVGGAVFNLGLNLLGFFAGVAMVRRHVGRRGAIFAAWLLALYPGAAYWVGQPFSYALIFPLGLAGFWLLLELPAAGPRRTAVLSFALGLIYLGYDFPAYFLPASVLILLWGRRYGLALLSAAIQVLPLGLWLWTLKEVVHLPLENSNTVVYRELLTAFFDPSALAANLTRLAALPETAADVFFGANFLFLPLLAVVAWALDVSWRDLARHRAVPAVLACGAALFLFCNVPPPHSGPWNLSGSWIARLYQPVFPALVLGLAWWWQERRPRTPLARTARLAGVGLILGGNALICFGPVAGLPVPFAETAFYQFYNHTDLHWVYERNLRLYGRRPLGFPRPVGAR